jgi:uncharacterized protein YkwD
VILACLLIGGTATALAPLAGAHTYGHHHRRSRHHRRHHHRRHHRRHGRRHNRAKAASSDPGQQWSATKPCPFADTPSTSATTAQMTAAVDCLVNQQRLLFHLPVMDVSSELNTSAQNWNDHMVGTGDFTHGSDQAFSNRLLAVGYNWGEGGENIATGFLTPRDAVAAWMASPEHCQNLLDPDYRQMGTGETPAPVGNFSSDPATWTQDFGLLMGQSPLSHNYAPMDGCPYTIPGSPTPSSSSSTPPSSGTSSAGS